MAQQEQQNQQNQAGMTPAQVLELVKEFAKELKKPTEEEQAKRDEQKARFEANRRQALDEANKEEQRKATEQAICSHMKGHPYVGKTYIAAPLHNDGLHHAFCFHCDKVFGVFAPSPETIPLGMTISDFSGLTPEIVQLWCDRYAKVKKAG